MDIIIGYEKIFKVYELILLIPKLFNIRVYNLFFYIFNSKFYYSMF